MHPSNWDALAGACGGELVTADAGLPGITDSFSAAVFSAPTADGQRLYRYALVRRWNAAKQPLVVIGLNPSTADQTQDDPTIARCTVRAERWGFGGLVMLNLFAYRSTQPGVMLRQADPIGPANDVALAELTRDRQLVIAAWGTQGHHRNRQLQVVRTLIAAGVQLHVLGLNANETPKHPLYVPYSMMPCPWSWDGPRIDRYAAHKAANAARKAELAEGYAKQDWTPCATCTGAGRRFCEQDRTCYPP